MNKNNKQPININIQSLIGTLIVVDSNASETIEVQVTEALMKALQAIQVEDSSLPDQSEETHE